MKKNKFILFFCVIWLISCTKMEIEPLPKPVNEKIFKQTENNVYDGQTIFFDLPSDGIYYLILTDIETGQVIGKEKFIGISGENIKKIYTKSIKPKYLYLTLVSDQKTLINKTKLIIN